MFGFFKRSSEMHAETTIIGRDMSTLIRFVSMEATEEIREQAERFEKNNFEENLGGDRRLRFAIDDFIVGYAVGYATRQAMNNGRSPKELPMEELTAELSARLKLKFPALDCESIYRSGSIRVGSGIFFGVNEDPEARSALERVLEGISPHSLCPEIDFMQYAYNCGGSEQHGQLALAAMHEMRERYGTE